GVAVALEHGRIEVAVQAERAARATRAAGSPTGAASAARAAGPAAAPTSAVAAGATTASTTAASTTAARALRIRSVEHLGHAVRILEAAVIREAIDLERGLPRLERGVRDDFPGAVLIVVELHGHDGRVFVRWRRIREPDVDGLLEGQAVRRELGGEADELHAVHRLRELLDLVGAEVLDLQLRVLLERAARNEQRRVRSSQLAAFL